MTPVPNHIEADQASPTFALLNEVMREINVHLRVWAQTEGMSDYERHQAIGTALLSHAAHYFRNVWGVSKDDFLACAEGQYDIHGDESKLLRSN